MDRRTFLEWVGVGFLASSLPVAIAACSSQTTPTASPSAAADFQPVGTVADLDKTGQLRLKKDSPVGPVVVIRNPKDKTALIALNALCPHEDCLVDWKADKTLFVCPCHDSEFDLDGNVLEGPAKTPLPRYEAKIAGDQILVKTSA